MQRQKGDDTCMQLRRSGYTSLPIVAVAANAGQMTSATATLNAAIWRRASAPAAPYWAATLPCPQSSTATLAGTTPFLQNSRYFERPSDGHIAKSSGAGSARRRCCAPSCGCNRRLCRRRLLVRHVEDGVCTLHRLDKRCSGRRREGGHPQCDEMRGTYKRRVKGSGMHALEAEGASDEVVAATCTTTTTHPSRHPGRVSRPARPRGARRTPRPPRMPPGGAGRWVRRPGRARQTPSPWPRGRLRTHTAPIPIAAARSRSERAATSLHR